MIVGAYLGLKQNDLKSLLAYSTISQLGVMMAMIGQDISIAFKALVIAVLAHALYKSALFMVAGIVDHETGTRDLRRLGGLRKTMPVTFVIAAVAGLSMAGLPPLFRIPGQRDLAGDGHASGAAGDGPATCWRRSRRGRRAAAGPGWACLSGTRFLANPKIRLSTATRRRAACCWRRRSPRSCRCCWAGT